MFISRVVLQLFKVDMTDFMMLKSVKMILEMTALYAMALKTNQIYTIEIMQFVVPWKYV